MNYAIGIDLGGTNIKAVAVDATGRVLQRQSCETQDHASTADDWVERMRAIITDFEKARGQATRCVGVATPGVSSTDHRRTISLPGKLAGVEGMEWTSVLQRDHPVPVLNDAHAALAGEAWCGAAANYRHAVLLTLGTGVGGAILSDGKLFFGAHGKAGSLGHVTLDPNGPPSIMRMPGSLEDAVGNRTVSERTAGKYSSTRKLVEAYRLGEPGAVKAWRQSVRALAVGIASFINVLDPEVVVIGGGIAAAGADLFDLLQAELDQVEYRIPGVTIKILPAALGEWAGAIGAARFAMEFDHASA